MHTVHSAVYGHFEIWGIWSMIFSTQVSQAPVSVVSPEYCDHVHDRRPLMKAVDNY